MLYGMYLSTGGMLTQRHRLDVIANNMANAQTTSFKRDVALCTTRPVESAVAAAGFHYRHPVLDDMGGGAFVSPQYTEFAQGEVDHTGRDLDVFIKGQGFLPVQDGNEVRYTRDGRLTISEQGYLVTVDGGRMILDSNDQPIRLDRSRQTEIKADGRINQEGEVVAELECVTFENPHVLRKVGDNLYGNPSAARGEKAPASLVTGALEKSTVDPVTELVNMIETQRAYEANAQMIRLQDTTLGRVINGLAQNV